MTRRLAPGVTYSTIGQTSRAEVLGSGGVYRTGWTPDYYPGHPDYVYEPDDKPRSSSQQAFATSSASRRTGRKASLAIYLDGKTPGWRSTPRVEVPAAVLRKAAVFVGVGERTASDYVRELRKEATTR